ncbi:MAG: Flp pilus assembly complex ATPase component TadA [Phycisphaerae bacterium]|nr:Flp pilus assembly complex ATPase component TadA [Phycisphaerae bacterium]
MGFNWDELLKGLGQPRKDAPKEIVPDTTAPAGAPQRSQKADQKTDQPSQPPMQRPNLGPPSGPGSAGGSDDESPVPPPITRPRAPISPSMDSPRPPDLNGQGFGEETDTSLAAANAPAARSRPDDAMSDVYTPAKRGAAGDLGSILLERGVIDQERLSSAQRILKQTPGKKLSQLLMESGIDEAKVQAVVAELARLPFERVDLKATEPVESRAFQRLGQEFCRQNLVLPLRMDGHRVVIGSTSPDDVFLLDDVKRRLGVPAVKHVLITAGDVNAYIQSKTEASATEVDIDEILANVDEDDVEVEEEEKVNDNVEADAESSPVVRYVNHIIQTALKEGASDIHIEPDDKVLKVRFRIDGVLFESMTPPRKMHAALTSRIKIMANLDIAERRLPQDGRIRVTVLGRKIDLRVSTVPTSKGEKTVMRILDNRSISVSLDDLGFGEDTLTIWKNQIDMPHGIILVTGPTGSGKTTTLYSSIRQMDTRRMNISTVEDPVEYNLAGITQIQTHEKIGMTFARALKALLRQDPDVVMVGEIRDQETANTAIQAALTGHLVLSTLHTNDAPSSITRLINIGIEPFLVGAAMNGVLAQRLVRKVCKHCAREEPVPDDMKDFLVMHGIDGERIVMPKGCSNCRETGYSGRLGIYELLVLDDFLRDRVAASPNVTEFRRTCVERGMVSLRQDGFEKVKQGRTTVEEVLRVTEATI